ncbi:hypothetical protein GOP47_0022739 [Adiantum capillus-veneris]|uniref:RRM domain-containing protein n=1 Tax=Adiantum capillus-veneris TaxID=13818 RepID=A0A9D4Z5T3_ADICA|nr:hypothetical protein GOP47_0022739 [Adiantum capillus-veneris]
MAAAEDGSPEENAGASLVLNGAVLQKSNRNSEFIIEFARQVRLRVKRTKRHVRPAVYYRKALVSHAKVKTSDEGLCNLVEANCPEAPAPIVESTVDKSEEMYEDVPDDDLALGQKGSHVLQETDAELPKPAHVVGIEERIAGHGEIDDLPQLNCYVDSGKGGFNTPLESLKSPESAIVLNSAEGNFEAREHFVVQTAVLHEPSMADPNGSPSKNAASMECVDHEGVTLNIRPNMHRDQEITYARRNRKERSNRARGPSRAQSVSISVQDGGVMSDTSKLELREHTVLETLLPDEPPGFSLDGGSDGGSEQVSGRCHGRIRKPVLERVANPARIEAGGSESKGQEPSAGSEFSGSESSHGRRGGVVRNGRSIKRFSPGTPGRGGQVADQVPSVLCDAEGNVWHIGKRAEQSTLVEDIHLPGPPKARFKERRIVALDRMQQSHGLQELSLRELPATNCIPYSHLVPFIWRWSERADINNETTNRMVVAKERSVFVGCIPDGIDNLEEILHGLMDRFLERFDFAPVTFGQIESVKSVKDFAFIELASDKVAQIVLAANQLDVFEWGVDGYHFNIQGCTSTCTAVRPSIEHLPLRPARVLFVGNIPEPQWNKDYLEAFFSKALQGSDRCTVSKYVVSVFLLPDSSDAYVEVASEMMADALIFKCTKNPDFLKEIGDDVFICRDTCSVPLMSRHKGTIHPQRCLVISVPPGGEELKINNVVKVFLDVLPFIARKSNQAGYLEFVLTEPGKDYAFFQFNSETFVDAIMDEYIESTQIFLCRGSPASYIILRPPQYIRPRARYRSGSYSKAPKCKPPGSLAYGTEMDRQKQAHNISTEQSGSITYAPRKFGDEPVKRPDFVISVGASPPPVTTWNGLTSSGCCASGPDCMIVVKGLPRGLSFKLARGALNELLERLLCDSGLLEGGRLLVTYLDRDGSLDVASLPDPEFVCAVLSIDSTFIVAGEEIRLLPYERKGFLRRSNSADLSGGPCELSSLSDEDSPGRMLVKNCKINGMGAPRFQQQRNRGHPDWEGQSCPKYVSMLRGPPGKQRTSFNDLGDEWGHGNVRKGSIPPKQSYKSFSQENVQTWHGANELHESWDAPSWPGNQRSRQPDNLRCQGNNPRVRISHVQKGNFNYTHDSGSDEGAAPRFPDKRPSTDDRFRMLSRENRRMIYQAGDPYAHEAEGAAGMGGPSARKRKLPPVGLGAPMHAVGFTQKMRRSTQFS